MADTWKIPGGQSLTIDGGALVHHQLRQDTTIPLAAIAAVTVKAKRFGYDKVRLVTTNGTEYNWAVVGAAEFAAAVRLAQSRP